MNFKHSGNLGDLIYSLPAMRFFGGGNLYLNPNGLKHNKYDGSFNGFNSQMISMMRPLLERQPYITSINEWSEESVEVNFDDFRERDIEIENLCEKILCTFEVSIEESHSKWINCGKQKLANTVISRSLRYQNSKIDYNKFFESYDDCVFVGLPEEHEQFEKMFSNIRYQPVNDFLQLAEIINGAELFVGNQSFALSLAVAMQKPFLQEYYPIYHDCIFDRKNARYMYANSESKT